MGINLVKGQNINLSKEFKGQSKFKIGLRWDATTNSNGEEFDLDSFAFELTDKVGNGGKVVSLDHMAAYFNGTDPGRANFDKITFRNPNGTLGFKSIDGACKLLGDARTGDVSENDDDEVIELDLSKVDPRTKSILIAVNIYSPGGSNFGQVKNPVVSIYKDNSDISEISYDLLEDYSRFTCIFAVEIYNHSGDWKIGALGVGKENWEDELTKLGIL